MEMEDKERQVGSEMQYEKSLLTHFIIKNKKWV